MAGAAMAVVSGKPEDIVGRWKITNNRACNRGTVCKPLFDIMACGEGWCGVEVEDGGKCGRTSLRLVVEKTPEKTELELSGQYIAAEGAEPYVVRAYVRKSGDGSINLVIIGHTGGQFQAFRRSFPVHMAFERVGEPTCRGEAKTS
jgi:hypothetical protein